MEDKEKKIRTIRRRRDWYIATLLLAFVVFDACTLVVLPEPVRVVGTFYAEPKAGPPPAGIHLTIHVVQLAHSLWWVILPLLLVVSFVVWKGWVDRAVVPLISLNLVFIVAVAAATWQVKREANNIVEAEKKVYDQMKKQLENP